VQYYSSSEEALTYHCMRTEFGLSNGNMDMKMRLTYKYSYYYYISNFPSPIQIFQIAIHLISRRYAADPNEEVQTGNITWQIPDPMRPEHWRHTEDHCESLFEFSRHNLKRNKFCFTDVGVYNTDVVDTDHNSWLILLHCSDGELLNDKKFLSTFVLSRTPYLDIMTMRYLADKVALYGVDPQYLFPVNQTFCFGEQLYQNPVHEGDITTPTESAQAEEEDSDMYFEDDLKGNNDEGDNDDDKKFNGNHDNDDDKNEND
jgi:hypothetical protein